MCCTVLHFLWCNDYVAHYYAALHCVAVCCSVLQRVAVCCSVLQCVALCCTVLQCVALRCNMLQCVAMCCTVLFVTLVASSSDSFVTYFSRPPIYTSHGQLAGWSCMNDSCVWRDSFFWGGGFPQGSHMTPNLAESSGMAYSLRVKDLLSSVMCMCVYVYTKHLHTWHKSRPSLCGCARKEKKNFTRKNRSCHSTSLNLAVTCVPTTHPAWLGHKSRPSLVEQSGGNDSYVRLFFPQIHTHILTILDLDTSQGQVWWSQVAWMILTWDNFFFQIQPHILTLLDLTHTGLNVLAKNRRNWQVNFMIQASKSQKRDFRHFCRAKVCYSNGNVRFENFMHMEWSEEKFLKGIVGDTRRLRFSCSWHAEIECMEVCWSTKKQYQKSWLIDEVYPDIKLIL